MKMNKDDKRDCIQFVHSDKPDDSRFAKERSMAGRPRGLPLRTLGSPPKHRFMERPKSKNPSTSQIVYDLC